MTESAQVVVLHFGALHGVEWLPAVLLVVGPIGALAAAIVMENRRAARAAADDPEPPT